MWESQPKTTMPESTTTHLSISHLSLRNGGALLSRRLPITEWRLPFVASFAVARDLHLRTRVSAHLRSASPARFSRAASIVFERLTITVGKIRPSSLTQTIFHEIQR